MAAPKSTIYRWPLDYFHARFHTAAFKQKWESPDFTVKGVPNAKFYIQFFPKGSQEAYKDGCAMYLYVRSFGEHPFIRLKYEIGFENGENKQLKKPEEERNFLLGTDNWGWPKMFTQKNLTDFAKSGTLVVVCKVISLDPTGTIKRALEVAPVGVLEKIAANFGADKFADVGVRVGTKVFKVTKTIICSGSSVFDRMFSHDTKEKETGIVEIKKEDPDMIESLLRFLYSGKVEGLPEVADRLLPVADCYEVLQLVDLCLESLLADVSVETVLRDLKLASSHDHKGDYEQKFLQFAKENFKLVKQQPDWTEEFVEQNAKIVMKIMDVAFQ